VEAELRPLKLGLAFGLASESDVPQIDRLGCHTTCGCGKGYVYHNNLLKEEDEEKEEAIRPISVGASGLLIGRPCITDKYRR